MPAAAVQYLQRLAGTGSDTMCGWAAELCCSRHHVTPQLPQVHRRHHHVERQKNLVRAFLAVACLCACIILIRGFVSSTTARVCMCH